MIVVIKTCITYRSNQKRRGKHDYFEVGRVSRSDPAIDSRLRTAVNESKRGFLWISHTCWLTFEVSKIKYMLKENDISKNDAQT